MNQRARTINQIWALVINTEGNIIKCKPATPQPCHHLSKEDLIRHIIHCEWI